MIRHTALALAAATALFLNGSMALATAPTPACDSGGVCAVSLRMMTPPPPRPATLMARHAQRAGAMILVSAD
ncbi:MAG: hypothetical protein Kow0013_13680 [Pararhodobacter sp.]